MRADAPIVRNDPAASVWLFISSVPADSETRRPSDGPTDIASTNCHVPVPAETVMGTLMTTPFDVNVRVPLVPPSVVVPVPETVVEAVPSTTLPRIVKNDGSVSAPKYPTVSKTPIEVEDENVSEYDPLVTYIFRSDTPGFTVHVPAVRLMSTRLDPEVVKLVDVTLSTVPVALPLITILPVPNAIVRVLVLFVVVVLVVVYLFLEDVIEFFDCLLIHYESGIINYDKRNRSEKIQTDVAFAIESIEKNLSSIDKTNKQLILVHNSFSTEEVLQTNYFRELLYNLEHSIHHQALIKVALHNFPHIALSESFGVAPSTLEYRKQCAQ